MVNLIYQINRQEKLHYIISKQTYIISKIEGVINFISFTALQIYRFYVYKLFNLIFRTLRVSLNFKCRTHIFLNDSEFIHRI